MGMSLSVYVGPYLVVHRSANIDLGEFDDVVYDGRGESGVGEKKRYLVPNRSLNGVKRKLDFDRDEDIGVVPCDTPTILREKAALYDLAKNLIKWCEENKVAVTVEWGVVPGWF